MGNSYALNINLKENDNKEFPDKTFINTSYKLGVMKQLKMRCAHA
jgi:hypothetical protein